MHSTLYEKRAMMGICRKIDFTLESYNMTNKSRSMVWIDSVAFSFELQTTCGFSKNIQSSVFLFSLPPHPGNACCMCNVGAAIDFQTGNVQTNLFIINRIHIAHTRDRHKCSERK